MSRAENLHVGRSFVVRRCYGVVPLPTHDSWCSEIGARIRETPGLDGSTATTLRASPVPWHLGHGAETPTAGEGWVSSSSRAIYALFVKHVRLLGAIVVVAAMSVTANTASSGAAAKPLGWTRVDLGSNQAAVAAVAHTSDMWWAAGSVIDETGEHRPSLWQSVDARIWKRVPTEASTGYGTVSILYALAASARGVVALGSATGGAHGNPRTVSWLLGSDGTLREIRAAFELYNGPRQLTVRNVIDTPTAWVIFGSRVVRNGTLGAALWTSASGDDFTLHDDDNALASGLREQVSGYDVAFDGRNLVAVGERIDLSPGAGAETDGIRWTSPDGLAWQRTPVAGLDFAGIGAQRPLRITIAGARQLIAGTEIRGRATRVLAWSSTNARSWTRKVVSVLKAGTADSDTVVGAAIVGSSFVVTARLDEHLVAASSDDGRVWTRLALPSDMPIGPRAVATIAGDENIVVAGAADIQGQGNVGGLWVANPTPTPRR